MTSQNQQAILKSAWNYSKKIGLIAKNITTILNPRVLEKNCYTLVLMLTILTQNYSTFVYLPG